MDPSDNKPCKITWKFQEDGTRVRVSKRTGTVVPKPTHEFKLKELHKSLGAKDTDADSVQEVTFDPATLNPLLRASALYREWTLGTVTPSNQDPL